MTDYDPEDIEKSMVELKDRKQRVEALADGEDTEVGDELDAKIEALEGEADDTRRLVSIRTEIANAEDAGLGDSPEVEALREKAAKLAVETGTHTDDDLDTLRNSDDESAQEAAEEAEALSETQASDSRGRSVETLQKRLARAEDRGNDQLVEHYEESLAEAGVADVGGGHEALAGSPPITVDGYDALADAPAEKRLEAKLSHLEEHLPAEDAEALRGQINRVHIGGIVSEDIADHQREKLADMAADFGVPCPEIYGGK